MNLPIEIWRNVVQYMDGKSVLLIGQTCKFLHRLTTNNKDADLWTKWYERNAHQYPDMSVAKSRNMRQNILFYYTNGCRMCRKQGLRKVYPFCGGIRLCIPCLYSNTINKFYFRHAAINVSDLPCTSRDCWSDRLHTTFNTSWYWKADIDKRIHETLGFASLEAYDRHLKDVAEQRQREKERLARIEAEKRRVIVAGVFEQADLLAKEDPTLDTYDLRHYFYDEANVTKGLKDLDMERPKRWYVQKAKKALIGYKKMLEARAIFRQMQEEADRERRRVRALKGKKLTCGHCRLQSKPSRVFNGPDALQQHTRAMHRSEDMWEVVV